MGERCCVCKGEEGEIPVKVNISFDRFEPKIEDKFICKSCLKIIKEYRKEENYFP